MATIEVPAAIHRLYKKWHEEHQRTGYIPARAVCGLSASGGELWCSFKDAGPDLLKQVFEYQDGAARAKLARYGEEPSPELAEEVAEHIIRAETAEWLLEMALDGKPVELGRELPPRFDLEGVYRLDADWRMPKRHARLEHAEQAAAFEESARPAVGARMRKELELLRPYWGPGVTKEQAVVAYLAADGLREVEDALESEGEDEPEAGPAQ